MNTNTKTLFSYISTTQNVENPQSTEDELLMQKYNLHDFMSHQKGRSAKLKNRRKFLTPTRLHRLTAHTAQRGPSQWVIGEWTNPLGI